MDSGTGMRLAVSVVNTVRTLDHDDGSLDIELVGMT